MKALKQILDFFLYSNIFIALCSSALTLETYLLLHSETRWEFIAFVFFSTLFLYNAQRLVLSGAYFQTNLSLRHQWISKNKKSLFIIITIAALGIAVSLFFFPLNFIFYLAAPVIISFGYFIPQTNFRSIPGLKAILIAFVWTYVTDFLPALILNNFSPAEIGGEAGKRFLIRFAFLLPLAIVFNIRDVEFDNASGIKTLPVIFGVNTTKIICLCLVLIFSTLVLFSPLTAEMKIAFWVSGVITGILISFASIHRTEYFYSLWLDGTMILQTGLVGVGVYMQNFLTAVE